LKYKGSPLQLKLKPDLISATFDLGQTHQLVSLSKDLEFHTWFNPYVQLETSRNLLNWKFNLGLIYTSHGLTKNTRFNIKNDRSVELEANHSYNRGGFLFNSYLKSNLCNKVCSTLTKSFNVAYSHQNFHFSVEGSQKNENKWLNLKMDTVQLGLGYSGCEKVNVAVTSDFNVNDFKNTENNLVVSGSENGCSYKLKLSDKLKAVLFTNVKLNSLFDAQCSLGVDFNDLQKTNGFLGNPFNLGLKLKYNE
jgi:hypothetical protein